jgi:diaminopimelate decarboxylase
MSTEIEQLRFLTRDLALEIADTVGTPAYVYDYATLKKQAENALAFPNAFGLTARFAMKASPNAAILRLFDSMGMHFDCSSVHEVKRAVAAGVAPSKCSLSSQELAEGFEKLVEQGVKINCCSILQLEKFCAKCPGQELGLRFNPGVGSGGTGKTNVGGPSSSFGIWHEYADKCSEIAKAAGCKVVRIHTHIGSGSDPEVWRRCTRLSISLVNVHCRAWLIFHKGRDAQALANPQVSKFPDVSVLNLGGGYKVARMSHEKGTKLETDCAVVKEVCQSISP